MRVLMSETGKKCNMYARACMYASVCMRACKRNDVSVNVVDTGVGGVREQVKPSLMC